MRLIDEEKLMEDMQKTITEQSGTIDWMNMIYRQPTAYDVDQVVEQLEELADESYKAYCIAFNSDDRAEYDAYTKAIEIVKQGGVSDDVCEWELDGDNLITSCGDYFNTYDNCTDKFKYCPRCGKKIKVVE